VTRKKKTVCLTGLALLLVGAATFWVARSTQSQRPLATIPLGDGRILRVEAVTYGVDHHVGNKGSDNLLWRLTAWVPWLYQHFASSNPESSITGLDVPSLVVWVNAVNAVTGTNVDCQGIRVELVNEHDELFGTATSSWSGGQRFWRVGHVFKVYPRDETNLTLRVTNWRNGKSILAKIPNPYVVRPAEWTGADLPQQTTAGDLNIVLANLRLRANNVLPEYYQTRIVYWKPVWELRRGTNKVGGWSEAEWFAEDPLGNRGQYLGTNQPFLRFSATFYPEATNTAAAELLATLPQSPVTNQQTVLWWNQAARQGTNDILVLGLFPPGTRVFEGSHLLTNPPVSMGPVLGGGPSGWTGMSRAVSPMKVVHYSSHYSMADSVIYVSAPDLSGPARLAIRLRDEQGRTWDAKAEDSANGIHPFLVELPPDVTQVTPELIFLPSVTATFTVNTRNIFGATEDITLRLPPPIIIHRHAP
jgi:hypothetical protein